MEFEKMYNSACGILGVRHYDEECDFEQDLRDFENHPDFSLFGHFDSTQDADAELEEQGFTLDEITKMSLNQYGNVIECLHAPDSQTYWVFVGAR